MLKRFLFASLLLSFAASVFAQYEVSVTTIPVWIKVQDKAGNPVKGLTAQDFEVFEDGKRIQTDCFEEITLQAEETQPVVTAADGAASPPVEIHRFIIYLDLYNTTPREYAAVKPALQNFLDHLAGKNAQVMLVVFMPDRRLGVVSRFTSDLNRIKIMLDFAKANSGRDVQYKTKSKDMQDVLRNPNEGLGKTAGTTQEDSTIDGYQTARVMATQEVGSSRMSLKALETFSEYISSLDLRNHASIILVSGGFSVDPGRRYFKMAEAFNAKGGADQGSQDKPQNRQTGFSFETELEESIGKLNRLNVTLYTLDTRAAETEPEFQDSLIQMARETGGLAFYNSNRFEAGLDRVQEDIKHQYLVCYSPPVHKTQGKYHKIRINVKRDGVDLRYRDGYWD